MLCVSKPIESPAPSVNPGLNCGLWVTICQHMFIDDTKCTTLVGEGLVMGEAVHVEGWGIEELSVLSAHLVVNLKLA